MRLATYNVENLFERPKAMNLTTWAEGAVILEDLKELNSLIQRDVYTKAVKTKLLKIMQRHKGLISNSVSKYIRLRVIRGKFISKPRNKPVQIAASGRADWIGWFELVKEAIKETAIENTARVIGLLNADVLCIIEAENRVTLKRFNEDIIAQLNLTPFNHIMLIDGNDDRGIDVGLVTKTPYTISKMRSHVDDSDEEGIIFSRDCIEHEIVTPKGNTLLIMINHFKSKGYGNQADSARKRLRQAGQVRMLYEKRIFDGYEYIAIVGDLNANPNEISMDPLIRMDSALIDIMSHANFISDGRPGTHGNGTASTKLDYILMSPKLAAKVEQGGIERRGVWGGKNGKLFPHLSSMLSEKDSASDHAALWVDFDI